MHLALPQPFGIVLENTFKGTVTVVQPLLDHIGIGFNIGKVMLNIIFAHHKTIIADLFPIIVIKVGFPVKRNVTAFYDQILMVLDGGLDHFPDNWPKKTCQRFIRA